MIFGRSGLAQHRVAGVLQMKAAFRVFTSDRRIDLRYDAGMYENPTTAKKVSPELRLVVLVATVFLFVVIVEAARVAWIYLEPVGGPGGYDAGL